MVTVQSKLDHYILWLTKMLLGLCLVTPLFISSSVLFSYTAPKAFTFRILIEITAVFYFYLTLKYSDFRPKKTALSSAVLVFLAIYFLAAVLGVDFYHSFWGDLERMVGFWGLVHFILFFLMLAAVFKTPKDWQNLLKISVGASGLVASLAILQKFTSLGLLMPQASRVYATIGNAGFLGTYLVFNIFFIIYLMIETASSKKKTLFTVYCLLLIIVCLSLLFTGTRGAYLGLAAGVFVCLLCFSFASPQKNWRKYFLAVLVLLIVLVGLLIAFRRSAFVQNNLVLRRATNISFKDTTIQNRLILWHKAWQAWQEKPMLGWGPENYEVAANQYFDPRLSKYEAWYDRAHNFIFDHGVTTGWLGLVSYLSLMGVALFYLKKIAKENFYTSVIFASLFIAYLVQNLFVFDVFVSYLMLFFVLALVGFVYKPAVTDRVECVGKKKATPLTQVKKITIVVLTLVILFSIYSFNIKPLYASYLANQILSSAPENFEQIEPLLSRILSLEIFASDEITYQVTLDYLDKINRAPQLTQNENFYKVALEVLTKSLERSPVQTRNFVALGWLNLYFSSQHSERIDEAIILAQKAKKLAPAKKDAYLILVAAYSLSGQNQKAQEIIKEVESIDGQLGREVREYWEAISRP